MKNIFKFGKRKLQEQAPTESWSHRRLWAASSPSPGSLSSSTYDEMQRDSMIQTALTVKKLAVLAGEYKIEPSDSGPAARRNAEFVAEAFERMEGSVYSVAFDAMDAFAKGWSIQEAVYEFDGDRVWLASVRPKDPSLFGLDLDEFGKIRGLKLQIPGEPERDLPREKFLLFAHRGGYGRPKGASDLDAAHRHWRVKQVLLEAWRVHLERFAMPTVLGKYQRGLTLDEQQAILAALRDLQNNTAIVFPNEIDLSTLGGDRAASSAFMDAIEFHNREIARSILGQTLTTDEGRRVGSLALGRVHLQVLLLQTNALRREIADRVLTEQLVRPLVELNFGPGDIPRIRFEYAEPEAFARGRL